MNKKLLLMALIASTPFVAVCADDTAAAEAVVEAVSPVAEAGAEAVEAVSPVVENAQGVFASAKDAICGVFTSVKDGACNGFGYCTSKMSAGASWVASNKIKSVAIVTGVVATGVAAKVAYDKYVKTQKRAQRSKRLAL